jgi:hypothetical protein
MRLTKRQADAVNQIIQEEVSSVFSGRQQVKEHARRAQLFEAAGGHEIEEARAKAEEAAALLSEARELLEQDGRLHTLAEEAFEAAYTLMSACDDEAGAPDTEREEPARGYPGGGGEDVNLPPMHPRGRG